MPRICRQRVVYQQQCTTVHYSYTSYQTQVQPVQPQPVQVQNLRTLEASNPSVYASVIRFDVPAGSHVPITYSGTLSNGPSFTNWNGTLGNNGTPVVNSAVYIRRERRNGRDYYVIGTRAGCTATFNIAGRTASSALPVVQTTAQPTSSPSAQVQSLVTPVSVVEVGQRLQVPLGISNIDMLRVRFSGGPVAPPTVITPADINEALRQYELVDSTINSQSGDLLLDSHIKENAYKFLSGYATALANYYQRHGNGALDRVKMQRYRSEAARYQALATQIAPEARTVTVARQIVTQGNFRGGEPSDFLLLAGSLAGLNTLEGERIFLESISSSSASNITFHVPRALINSNDVTLVNQDFERITALADRVRTRESVSEETKRKIYRLCVAYARSLSNHYRVTDPERSARLEVTAQMYESYLPRQNTGQAQTTQQIPRPTPPDPNHFLNFTFGDAHSSQRNDYSRAICFDFHCGSSITISYHGTINENGIVRTVSGSTHDINHINNAPYANVPNVLYAMRQSNGNGTGRCGIGICHGYKGNITITVNGRSHTLFVP